MNRYITILNGVKHLFLLLLAIKKRIYTLSWHRSLCCGSGGGSSMVCSGAMQTFVLFMCVTGIRALCTRQDISSRRQCSNNVPMSKNSKNWNLMRCIVQSTVRSYFICDIYSVYCVCTLPKFTYIYIYILQQTSISVRSQVDCIVSLFLYKFL